MLKRIVMEVMQEIYARLPYKQKFQLSDGSIAHIEKFVAPCINDQEGHSYDGCPQLGFDVKIEGGPLDHIEFMVHQTGWGRALKKDKGRTR